MLNGLMVVVVIHQLMFILLFYQGLRVLLILLIQENTMGQLAQHSTGVAQVVVGAADYHLIV
jgi:hypothetical protein